jgi:hypothetical protein
MHDFADWLNILKIFYWLFKIIRYPVIALRVSIGRRDTFACTILIINDTMRNLHSKDVVFNMKASYPQITVQE